jgi:hypothetical protein
MSTIAATGAPTETSLDDVGDEALLRAFEDGRLAPGAFRHRHHVRTAWILLERLPVLDVLARFTAGLRRLAAAAGKPGLYHETITWAYVLLVNERRAAAGAEGWPAFAARNPDLLLWKPSVLEARYYREETLWSERARETFVLPDRPLTA